MILKLISLLMLLQLRRCSVVIDSQGQKGIYVSEFCPKMEYCAEGAHVMCMYYQPKQVYGPRCSNPRNMTITPDLANHLLDISNAIRSKIAKGNEKGRDNVQLPIGYGIFRLKWDNELATFAQVLANQCVLRHDLCRATKRFPDPGQTAGMIRLTVPDWKPLRQQPNKPALDVPGLNPEKITYFVTQILKSWYSQKTSVTKEMIENYPNWSLTPTLPGRVYLELVHGTSTRMGCGMTAYTEFNYFQRQPNTGKPGGINYNTVLLICNFSSHPKIGQQAYLTSRPPYSSLCGCPEGTQEDSDCLCVEATMKEPKDTKISTDVETSTDKCSDPDGNCDQTLVVLPIFTVEDAPPEKLHIEDSPASFPMDRLDNRSNAVPRTKSMEIFNFFEDTAKEPQTIKDPTIQHQMNAVMMPTNSESIKPPMPFMKPVSLSSTYREAGSKKMIESEEIELPEISKKPIAVNKQLNIITKAATFELPNEKINYGQSELVKSIVKPREDFNNIQRVANEYLKQRNSKLGNNRPEITTNKREGVLKYPYTTTIELKRNRETILNKAEDKIMDSSHIIKKTLNSSIVDNAKRLYIKYDESDNKLLNLLDNLEQEVKHIELDGDEKEIFDAKIKKIYGSVVGMPGILSVTKIPSLKNNDRFLLSPVSVDRAQDFAESDIRGSKAFFDHDINHFIEDDFRSRLKSDHFVDDRNSDRFDIEKKINLIKNYESLDRNYKGSQKHSRNIGSKERDIVDNRSVNENDMFENNPKSFTDIERKYNAMAQNFGLSKSEQKYNDEEADILAHKYRHLIHKYDNIDDHLYASIPAPRSQNGINKYETEPRLFDSYRERTAKIGSNGFGKTYLRHGENNGRYDGGDRNRRISFDKHNQEQDDILTIERRKYYQEKLNNLEKRLRNTHSYQQSKTGDSSNTRKMRRILPNLDDTPKSKTQGDTFYVPDRARFLHGF